MVMVVLVGVIVLLVVRSQENDSEVEDEVAAAEVEDKDEAPTKTDVNFAQIYNEHCVTAVEKQVCRLAKPQKTLTLLVSLQDMATGTEAGHNFSQLFYEITDALGIDQEQVMTDEVLDKIFLGEYSVEMQFGAVRIVQFVFEGVYFASFVVVSGYDNIYENSSGPLSTEYTLMEDAENTEESEEGKVEEVVANSSVQPSTTSAVNIVTVPTSSVITSTTTTQAPTKQPEVKPVEINTSMTETTSIWGTDANLEAKLARAHKYVYSGREFKLSDDGMELTLEVTAEEVANTDSVYWSQKLSDMNATVYIMNKNEKRYNYFTKEMLVPDVKKAPLVVCNLEQGIRYNASKGSWTLYLKLRPKAKC